MAMDRLFGTDGIRGEVGKHPLTQEAVFTIGRALGVWLKQQYPSAQHKLKVVVGKDTRDSGDELELALSRGAQLEHLEVLSVGVCPTPCVAYLTKALGAHLGLAISASHNPGCDNGIKFFDADGYKLFPPAEKCIEELFYAISADQTNRQIKDFKTVRLDCLHLYADFAKNSLASLNLAGFTVVIDCAFGSFSKLAPQVLHELGAAVHAIHDEPDGTNINVNCGTLHPQTMAKKIREHRADIGIAFDGDGDRVIVADENGQILDGDHILAILSRHLQKEDKLKPSTVVCTQMSNLGLEIYLKRKHIRMVRTKVGDKYVLQEMLKLNAALGGEQSGHIIILERTTTGDGLIVALELIKVMRKEGKRLSELAKDLRKFPQVLVNIKVKEKKPFEEISGLKEAIKRSHAELGQTGRLLLRYSGTENLARVMVEGPRAGLIHRVADSVAKVIRDAVGQNN